MSCTVGRSRRHLRLQANGFARAGGQGTGAEQRDGHLALVVAESRNDDLLGHPGADRGDEERRDDHEVPVAGGIDDVGRIDDPGRFLGEGGDALGEVTPLLAGELFGVLPGGRLETPAGGEKLGEDDRNKIEAAIEDVEEAMKSDDKDSIEAATNKLTEAAQVIYQQAAAAAEAEAAGAQDPGASAEAASDDVVDAEFEEVDENKGENK